MYITILCLIHWFYWFWVLEIHIGNILHWTLLSYYTLAYLAGITENCCTNTSYYRNDLYYTKTG